MPIAVKQSGAVGYDMRGFEKELKGMRKDLAGRPTQHLSKWVIDGIIMGLTVTEKKDGIEYQYNKPFDA